MSRSVSYPIAICIFYMLRPRPPAYLSLFQSRGSALTVYHLQRNTEGKSSPLMARSLWRPLAPGVECVARPGSCVSAKARKSIPPYVYLQDLLMSPLGFCLICLVRLTVPQFFCRSAIDSSKVRLAIFIMCSFLGVVLLRIVRRLGSRSDTATIRSGRKAWYHAVT